MQSDFSVILENNNLKQQLENSPKSKEMRKKFYLIATLAMLCWHTGNAQADPTRHSLFGMRAKVTVKKTDTNAADNSNGKAAPSATFRTASLEQLPKVSLKAPDKVTKTVLTGYTDTWENESRTSSTSLTYNENGRVTVIDEEDYKETLNYVEGTHGQWIELSVQRIEKSNNKVTSSTKFVRTQDERGRIVAEKIYSSWDGEPLKLGHSYAYTYEYSDQSEGNDDFLFVIEDVDYSVNPDGIGFKWVSIGEKFYECNLSDHERADVTKDGNNYVFTRKAKNFTDGEWFTYYQKTTFCDNDGNETGYLEVNYESDGVITSVYGSKTEKQLDTPSAGYQTSISYKYNKADGAENVLANYSWTPAYKNVFTDNYEDQHITPDGKPRIKRSYSYDSATQSWKETESDVSEWVKPNILKTVSIYKDGSMEEKEVYYTVYSDEGEDIGSAMLFSDGSYVIVESEETTSEADFEEFFYTVYNAQGVAEKKYKEVEYKNERTDDFASHFSAEPVKWYVWNGSSWQTATGTLQFGDGDNRLVCTLDSKGRPIEVIEYEDNKVDDHYKYTYLPNGYVDESYEMKADGRDEYLSDSYTRTIDGDGNYEAVEYEYTEGGYSKYGKKTRVLTNGISEVYDWRNGEFKLSSRYVSDLVTEKDGVRTQIRREIKEDGDRLLIEETEKSVTTDRGNEHTSESYTKENGQWVGQYKSSTFEVDSSGFTWRVVNPLAEYGVVYSNYRALFDDMDSQYHLDVPDSRIDYAWEDGHWVVSQSTVSEVKVEGNTETVTTKSDYDGYSSTETHTFKRDSEGRLLEEKKKESITQSGMTQTSFMETYYTLDSEGKLLSKKEVGNDYGPVTTTYSYGKISVVDGIGSVTANDAPKVAVNGNTITAEGCADIALYSVDGSLAATGTNGTVTAPAKGLYILKAGKDSVKVLVR